MACIFYKMPYVFSDIPHAASHNPKNYKSKRISVQTKTRCKHTGLHLVFALNVPTTLLLLNCPDHNHSIGTIILFPAPATIAPDKYPLSPDQAL